MKIKQETIKKIAILVIATTVILLLTGKIYANSQGSDLQLKKVEYSEEYQNWLELSDEEKAKTIQPRMFDISFAKDNATYLKSINNPFKVFNLLKGTTSSTFNLKDIIPENMTVKDQKDTNECWAFATLSSLESCLAMKDYEASKQTTVYDFSERHMDYSTVKSAFLNDAVNPNSHVRNIKDGANIYIALAYLTNGRGAIPETEMPFEDNQDNIDISSISGKTVSSTVKDTIEFDNPTDDTMSSVIASMKEYITKYGAIYASIYQDSIQSCETYNNETAALNCLDNSSKPANHAVTIVGWDDTFSKDNFPTQNQPTNDGAWIIKNSWGSETKYELTALQQQIFNEASDTVKAENNWTEPTDITEEFLVSQFKAAFGDSKVYIDSPDTNSSSTTEQDNNTYICIEVGDEGFMYVSYEDANIYTSTVGIKDASANKEYDNIYQHDMLGASACVSMESTSAVYQANVFNRDSTKQETLKSISLQTLDDGTYEVYVNPNDNDKTLSKLQKVDLSSGSQVTLKSGYHVLELSKPITLTGDSFVVAVKSLDNKKIMIEAKQDNTAWSEAEVNAGESFYTNEETINADNTWNDLGTEETAKGNSTIKAYTNNVSLSEISIATLPNKVEYIQNQDTLDLTGGKIELTYSDNTTSLIDMDDENVSVTGFDNTTLGKNTLTVTYKDKTTTFDVTISENVIVKPVSSDLTEAKAEIIGVEINSNYDVNSITITVSNIKTGNEDNTYEYYYYVSQKNNETEITDWVKIDNITQDTDGNNIVTFDIDEENAKDIEETESEQLYVYLKEVAKTGTEVKEQISDPLQTTQTEEVKTQLADAIESKLEQIKIPVEEKNDAQASQTDNTTATSAIPQTGMLPTIAVIVFSLVSISVVSIRRYKNIDK